MQYVLAAAALLVTAIIALIESVIDLFRPRSPTGGGPYA
jgi:hypothetical protein